MTFAYRWYMTPLEAASSPLYSHARARGAGYMPDGSRAWWITLYWRAESSPTGVVAVVGGYDEDVSLILKALEHTSPLSPTEDR